MLIPVYNAERWIANTIDLAPAQAWPRKEIIVVDDGSADQTLQMARQFASKNVSVVAHTQDGAEPAHAARDLARASRIDSSCRTLGHPAIFGWMTENIFAGSSWRAMLPDLCLIHQLR
ncbi:MAG: glycosyltransferase [Verrucomicrobia bacterium]|nr:MAG: glycosyltransferase [Verrucomicrobiota bacterium]